MIALVIRHAESRDNVGEHEHSDSDLSELGRRQAARLAERLRVLSVGAIYSSPFRRAVQTAMPIAEALGLSVRMRGELCEFHGSGPIRPGDYRLPEADSISREYGRIVRDPDEVGGATWPPMKEAMPDLVVRQQRFVAQLRARWTREEDVVAVVGHGSPIARLIEAWLTDKPGASFRFVIENAAITCLRFVGGVRSLLCLNDVRHLAGLEPSRGSQFTPEGGYRLSPPPAAW